MDDVELTAKQKLRAFEDDVLGPDVVRISGEIEKGHGSNFKKNLTEEQRQHHARLEHLVVAEEKLAHASAALASAEAEHEKAKAHVEEFHTEPEHDDAE